MVVGSLAGIPPGRLACGAAGTVIGQHQLVARRGPGGYYHPLAGYSLSSVVNKLPKSPPGEFHLA